MQMFEQLESKFRDWIGQEWNTVAVNSGTSALHLGLEALELPPGSKVLVPDYCMYAIPRAVVLAGHVPVFGDCYAQNLNLNIDMAVKALGQITCEEIKAVVVVHNFGRRAFMDGIREMATRFKWKVIEDLAEAHGVSPHLQTDVACWSFYKNKIIAGEEGGMIAFRQPYQAKLAQSLRCLGFTPAHDFWHVPRGANARMANALAKPILDSLISVNWSLKKRKEVETCYDCAIPDRFKQVRREVVWVYDVRLPGCTFELMAEVVSQLNANGVEARQGFKSNCYQPEFSIFWKDICRPESYCASQEVMYLPVRPTMTLEEIDRNATEFLRAVKSRGL